MKLLKRVLLTAGAIVFAAIAHAAPATLTQKFSDVVYTDYGRTQGIGYGQTPVGDWVFTATLEMSNAEFTPGYVNRWYRLDRLTLTQESLGLFNAEIVNMPFAYFLQDANGFDRFGFVQTISGFGPWTLTTYKVGHFLPPQTFEQLLSSLTTGIEPEDDFFNIGPQWDYFEFSDGRRLYGVGSGTSSIKFSSVSAVPLPGTIPLIGAAVLVWGIQRRRGVAAI